MDNLLEVAGRFHPVVVHLPIGFLLLAALFIWLPDVPKRLFLITLGAGALASAVAVASGLILEDSGDYNTDATTAHRWAGITVFALASTILLVARKRDIVGYLWRLASIAIVASLTAAGHLGGELTHGEGYLLEPLRSGHAPRDFDLSALNPDSTYFYQDAIAPILESKCIGCHGSSKQKGELRLDSREHILKGGKSGSAINISDPGNSELLNRIQLPPDDDDHMPPREKKQLTEQEHRVLVLWVESGADFNKKISQLVDKTRFNPMEADGPAAIRLPEKEIASPDPRIISQLIESGASVTPVSRESNYLQVNLISTPGNAAYLLTLLSEIAANVVSLKVPEAKLDEQSLSRLTQYSNLSQLSLARTNLDDAGMKIIARCTSLTHLNIEGTSVTEAGIVELKALHRLRYLNLYRTNVSDKQRVREMLPGTGIEFGGYEVPTLPTDTVMLRTN